MTDSVTKQMSKMSVAEVSSATIVNKFSTDALRGLYKNDFKNASTEEMKKRDFRNHVNACINQAGAKIFITALSTEQLAALLEPVNINHAHNNEKARVVLLKRSMEQLTNGTTVAGFLRKYTDDMEVLRSFAETMEVPIGKSAKKDEIIEKVTEQLDREAVRTYFESLTLEVLRDIAYDLGLEKNAQSTASKAKLLKALTTLSPVEKTKKKKATKIVISSKKPKIKEGISYDDMFQYYNVTDLVDYAKKNGIKTTGTKKELILRIIAWLEGDKENTLAGVRKPRKAKRGGKKAAAKKTDSKKMEEDEAEAEDDEDQEEVAEEAPKEVVKPKQAAKQTTTKNTKPAKVPTPVESEAEDDEGEDDDEEDGADEPEDKPAGKNVEETAADDQEEEGDDEEIDLDNLESYPISFLRKYCEEESIKISASAKKVELIKAILEYNE